MSPWSVICPGKSIYGMGLPPGDGPLAVVNRAIAWPSLRTGHGRDLYWSIVDYGWAAMPCSDEVVKTLAPVIWTCKGPATEWFEQRFALAVTPWYLEPDPPLYKLRPLRANKAMFFAIRAAVENGAQEVNVYGADWAGDRDYDPATGEEIGSLITADRWELERERFARCVKDCEKLGILLRRCI